MTINMSELVRGGTVCLNTAALAVGSSGATIDIAGTDPAGVNFCINGIMYWKANAASEDPSDNSVQAELTSCLYLVCLDYEGTLTTVKGTEVVTADITSEEKVLTWPIPTEDTCCIGAVRVDTDDGYTFTMGTTELSAAGITDTYYNLFAVPDTPLTS